MMVSAAMRRARGARVSTARKKKKAHMELRASSSSSTRRCRLGHVIPHVIVARRPVKTTRVLGTPTRPFQRAHTHTKINLFAHRTLHGEGLQGHRRGGELPLALYQAKLGRRNF